MNIYIEDFNLPDDKDPNYSQLEVDFYGWIPANQQKYITNHRLSVRKNLKTNQFEAYAHYYSTISANERDEILYINCNLSAVLRYADNMFFKFHGIRHDDIVLENRGFIK